MELVSKYFPGLTAEQKSLFAELLPLYLSWNAKINVISRKDMDHFFERHVLHSLAIAKFIGFKKNTRILDAGTGGGFPGIPLAIFFPEVSFLLADSIGKKIKVVDEIITSLELKNVSALKIRAEDTPGNFDFVVCRAVAGLSEIVSWTSNKISRKSFNEMPNGIICLKGGSLDTELEPFSKKNIQNSRGEKSGQLKITNINSFFEEEFFSEKKIVYLPR